MSIFMPSGFLQTELHFCAMNKNSKRNLEKWIIWHWRCIPMYVWLLPFAIVINKGTCSKFSKRLECVLTLVRFCRKDNSLKESVSSSLRISQLCSNKMINFYLEMKFYIHIHIIWGLHTDTYEHDTTCLSCLTNMMYCLCSPFITEPYVSLCSEITA